MMIRIKHTNRLYKLIIKSGLSSSLGISMDKFKMQLHKTAIQRVNLHSMQSYEHTAQMPAGRQAVFIYCTPLREFTTFVKSDRFSYGIHMRYHFFICLTFKFMAWRGHLKWVDIWWDYWYTWWMKIIFTNFELYKMLMI